MKFFISTIIILLTTQVSAQTSIYELSIQNLDGKTIPLSEFKGRKILIASLSPDNMKNGNLDFLDSIQKAYPAITVIAVPANDFGGSRNSEIIGELKNIYKGSVILAAGSNVKKDKGASQNLLFKWLTSQSDNMHFNDDVDTDSQVYVVSESGILYAIMVKGFENKVITNVLTQEDMKQ